MKRSRENPGASQEAPQAENGPPEKQRRTPRGRPRKTPASPVESQDGHQEEAQVTSEPVAARGTGTRRGRGRPRRASTPSIGGDEDNGGEKEGGQDRDIPDMPGKLPPVQEPEEPSTGTERPGSRTRGRTRNASIAEAQEQAGGPAQQRRSSRKRGSPAPVEDVESDAAVASTMAADDVGRQAEAPVQEAAVIASAVLVHEVATDQLSGAGSGHGDRSSPSNDVTVQPGMPCADSTSRDRDGTEGAAATSGAAEPESISVGLLAEQAECREGGLLQAEQVLGGAAAVEVTTGGPLVQGERGHGKPDDTAPVTGSLPSAAAKADTAAPHGSSPRKQSASEAIAQAGSKQDARAGEQEQVTKEVTAVPEGSCSPLAPSTTPAPSPSKAHLGASGSSALSRQKRPFLPMPVSSAPGVLPTRDSVTSLPTRTTGLPARSSKWGETSLGLRGSLLSSAPSSHAPSTLLSRAKHEHADGAHEGGVSDKQPPVPSIGLVSSPLKLSALDPPSAALAQSLPKPDFKIPRSGVDKKTQLAGAQEKLRATIARSSVLQHAKHQTHVQEPIDKEASFIASHIKEWKVYNDQDHEIPEARAPCEVPLLEKDWQKYGNGKSDQSHLWWGVNLSASDR